MMTTIRTDLGETRERARELRFEPSATITSTNVQKAIEEVAVLPPTVSGTNIAVASSPYAVLPTDSVLYVDTSGGPVQILLPASAARLGRPLTVKDVTGDAGTNNVTLTPSGAEVIDGLASVVISSPFGGYRLYPRTLSYTLAP